MAEPNLELIQAMLQQVLDKQRQHDGNFAEQRLRMIAVEQRVTSIDTRLDAIQLQLTNLSDRVGRLETKVGLIEEGA